MSFFGLGKKRENVPNIPQIPMLPPMPQQFSMPQRKAPTSLPSFPHSSYGENFNQQMVKSAFDERRPPQMSQMQQMPMIPPMPRQFENFQSPQENKSVGQVFVKVSKFQEAKKDFERVKESLIEIETAFNKLAELRAKEDKEFYEWMQDLGTVKERLAKMDAELFGKI